MSDVANITLDFINSNSFIRRKLVNGKGKCDKCGTPFPTIVPFFVVADESSEELLCHPCNYIRLGIDVKEMYAKKRSAADLGALRLLSAQNKKSVEKAKKPEKVKAKAVPVPDLFSNT